MLMLLIFTSIFGISLQDNLSPEIQKEIIIKKEIMLCEKTEIVFKKTVMCAELTSINNKFCQIFANELQLFSKFENQYNKVTTEDGEMVLYSSKGELYKTECKAVNVIQLSSNIDECTIDLPIIYITEEGSKRIAFLTKEAILRLDARVIPCSDSIDYFHYSNIEIMKQNKIITFKKIKDINEIPLNTHKNTNLSDKILEFYESIADYNGNIKVIRDFLILVCLLGIVCIVFHLNCGELFKMKFKGFMNKIFACFERKSPEEKIKEGKVFYIQAYPTSYYDSQMKDVAIISHSSTSSRLHASVPSCLNKKSISNDNAPSAPYYSQSDISLYETKLTNNNDAETKPCNCKNNCLSQNCGCNKDGRGGCCEKCPCKKFNCIRFSRNL